MTRDFHDTCHVTSLSLLQALVLSVSYALAAAPPVEAMTTPRVVCAGPYTNRGTILLGNLYLPYSTQQVLRQGHQEVLAGLRAASSEVSFSVRDTLVSLNTEDCTDTVNFILVDSPRFLDGRLKLLIWNTGSFPYHSKIEPRQMVKVEGMVQQFSEETWWGTHRVNGEVLQQTASALLTDYLHKLGQADTEERLKQQRLEEDRRAAAQEEQERQRAEEARQEVRRAEEAKREAEKQRQAEHEAAVRAWIAKLSPTLKTSDDVK